METLPPTTQNGGEGASLSRPAFQFHHTQHAGVTVLVFQGELEDEDKAAFREILLQGRHSGERENAHANDLVLDLGGVTFLSEQALAVLVEALKAQYARGASLRLIAASDFVQKKLKRTGLAKYFPASEPEANDER